MCCGLSTICFIQQTKPEKIESLLVSLLKQSELNTSEKKLN